MTRSNFILVLKLVPVYLFIFFIIFSVVNHDRGIIAEGEISSVTSSSENVVTGAPVEIIIPEAEIKVPVRPGNYDPVSEQWEISDKSAYYMTQAGLPNSQQGHTIIYAHNTNDLFGNTGKLKKGDKVYLKTKNSRIFIYEYDKEKNVSPDDVSIINDRSGNKLTLITCGGIFNDFRRIMEFKFLRVV